MLFIVSTQTNIVVRFMEYTCFVFIFIYFFGGVVRRACMGSSDRQEGQLISQ